MDEVLDGGWLVGSSSRHCPMAAVTISGAWTTFVTCNFSGSTSVKKFLVLIQYFETENFHIKKSGIQAFSEMSKNLVALDPCSFREQPIEALAFGALRTGPPADLWALQVLRRVKGSGGQEPRVLGQG